MRALASGVLSLCVAAALAAPAAGDPAPTDPAYTQRDLQNPAYLRALVAASTQRSVDQLLTQAASPTHPALTAGNVVRGWNVGDLLRAGWNGARGLSRAVTLENRYGAQLLRGHVYKPLPGAVDPTTTSRTSAAPDTGRPGTVETPEVVAGGGVSLPVLVSRRGTCATMPG